MTCLKRSTLPLLLLSPLVLIGCGQGLPGGAAAAERARAQGVAPELVYVTEISGFDLAEQSMGVVGDEGFGSVYVSAEDGRQISLTVLHGRLDAATCPDLPLADGSGASSAGDGAAVEVRCEQDGDLWYRTAGAGHEYARAVEGGVLHLTADSDRVDGATLRSAAENAQLVDAPSPSSRPSGSPDTLPTAPVERGDLPPDGDGAPVDPPHVGG